MFVMNIKDIIGEATEYDKKRALKEKKPKSWCKSVSAFANTFGGALIFGISDDDQVVGLEDPKGDADKISETIKTRLDPIPEFKLRFHKTEDGKVGPMSILWTKKLKDYANFFSSSSSFCFGVI